MDAPEPRKPQINYVPLLWLYFAICLIGVGIAVWGWEAGQFWKANRPGVLGLIPSVLGIYQAVKYALSAKIILRHHTMKYRKLRIAWSVAWGIATLMLVGLTIRSYWTVDGVGRVSFTASDAKAAAILLDQGVLSYSRLTFPADPNSFSGPTDQWIRRRAPVGQQPERFAWQRLDGDLYIHVPTWVPGLFFFAAAWIPLPRFSLRTLLIATTLVALVLGLIVYALRS